MSNLLKNWISGLFNAKDEKALEQAASKDEFLAEALDGYRQKPESDHQSDINQLKNKLKQQYTSGTANPGFSLTKIAAAAALVIAVGTFFWLQKEVNPNKEEIADSQVKENVQPSPKATPQNDIASRKDTINLASGSRLNNESDVLKLESEPKALAKANANTRDIISDTPPPVIDPSNIEAGIMDEGDIVDADIEATTLNEELVADAPVPASASPVDAYSDDAYSTDVTVLDSAEREMDADVVSDDYKKDEAATIPELAGKAADISETYGNSYPVQNVVRGRILELNSNDPLIGVNVLIANTSEGAVTDFEGNYTITSTEPLPWQLEVTYTGYETKQVFVDTSMENLIVYLDEGNQLMDEVVVTSSRISKKRESAASMSTVGTTTANASPKGGFKKFKRYIRKKLEYPQAAKDAGVEGTVKVQFYINEFGRPTEFAILQSLGFDCDKEAVRLLEKGPKWSPVNRYAEVEIIFKN